MAIQVINHKYKAKCPGCLTEFTYETEDVKPSTTSGGSPYVVCPKCKAIIFHTKNAEQVDDEKPYWEEDE